MVDVPNPISASVAWLGAVTDAHRWVSPASAAAGAIAGGVLFSRVEVWSIIVGAVAVILSALPEACASWWRGKEEAAHVNALARHHLLFHDALIPIAELTAQMLGQDGVDREATYRQVLQQAVGSCILPFSNDLDVRALVFVLDEGGQSMACAARTGRHKETDGFTRGTTRTEKALKVLKKKKPVIVADLDKAKPREWAGTGDGYRSFVTVPIYDSKAGYGLLSIDTPIANTFSASDVVFVKLVASMLAVVFADRSRPLVTTGPGSTEEA